MNGILLVDKPSGITSFELVKQVKKQFNINIKIGHSGVLDKFACGLMVLGIGKGTKYLSSFEKNYKIYRAKITFGYETDTLDATGKVVYKSKYYPTLEEISSVIKRKFIGKIEQIVPLYSNVKVNGKRLYKYALSHQQINPPKKTIYISNITILNYNNNILDIEVVCSKGTYIRALSRDIARSINTFATLTFLERLFIFPFSIENAKPLSDLRLNDIISIEKVKDIIKINHGGV